MAQTGQVIRVALVGCGGMGGSYRQALEDMKGRFRVTACVDIDEARARAMAATLGAERHATDYRSVLDDVDAVFLVLPHDLHHPVGMECLARGKHVLMEKPLAIGERECLDLIEASRRARRTLMVAYCMRYHPLLIEMGRLITTRAYGDPFHVSIWTEQMTRRPDPESWVHKRARIGGGQLFSHGCHYIDLLLAWLGDPVSGTHAGTMLGTPWLDFEGTSDVSMRFEGGAVGYHMGTWGARGSRLKYAFHAHCTEGMVELDWGRGQLILHREAEEGAKGKEQVLMSMSGVKAVAGEIEHFIECVETGRRPLTDGPQSLQGLRVIWRVYEAEEQGVVADLRGLGFRDAG
jgi:predicted dehydrogenase